MISRRQIIRAGHHQADQKLQPQQQHSAANSSGSSAASSGCSSNNSHPSSKSNETNTMMKSTATSRQQQVRSANQKMLQNSRSNARAKDSIMNSQQQDSSDGYVAASSLTNQYEDYASWAQSRNPARNANNNNTQQLPNANYRSFDPYSIYSEEEDVWYSEERLFEDHLDEIYNKWPLLDDDIWCKLIIMERNRRIGKAYARVPIVTIDGSHELSYDGYKLALNGFDNPDRDLETEQCRKRIGKGIRIKMDNFGNILIKRLSKSGVFVKEYLNPLLSSSSSNSNGGGDYSHHLNSASHFGGSSNGGANGDDINGGRVMPSRQQLIKNQNALLAAANKLGAGRAGSNQSNGSTPPTTVSSTSSAGGASSMEPSNDSAICDEIIDVGGRLDLDKIYILFDMKKFQANITQELCRRYPDRHKLEQQCFSIVGLSRDNDDILSLPCWVMVINIVAIEMLNERFPLEVQPSDLDYISSQDHLMPHLQDVAMRPVAPPNFVSIFDQQKHSASANRGRNNQQQQENNKEEDPYSLPANASSSDVRSSIHDYGGSSNRNNATQNNAATSHRLPSRYYNASKAYSRKGELAMNQSSARQANEALMRHRSKSNYEIYGHGQLGGTKLTSNSNNNNRHHQERYNNNSSIYSPGHMLVQPASANDSMPPKLPPRDFVKKSKSRSSTDVCDASCGGGGGISMQTMANDKSSENIYSTGNRARAEIDEQQEMAKVARKSKKNRFLESLKAPLDQLAKSSPTTLASSNNNKSTGSVLDEKSSGKKKSGLKSFLGVGKSASKVVDEEKSKHSKSSEADSVVDSTSEDRRQQQPNRNLSSSALNYTDLDIPTPDYETDENIYAIEESARQQQQQYNKSRRNSLSRKDSMMQNGKLNPLLQQQNNKQSPTSSKTTKDDLYYSGFLAHVPRNGSRTEQRARNGKPQLPNNNCDDSRMSCVENQQQVKNRLSSRRSATSNAGGGGCRDLIYGSTIGLQHTRPPPTTGSRYRSASVQRVYPRSSQQQLLPPPMSMSHRSQDEIYDLETENPYAMSGHAPQCDLDLHYGMAPPLNHTRAGSKSSRLMEHKIYSTNQSRLHSGANASTTLLNNNSGDYDIGRSSSGIYGVNSGSSSSDYADLYPKLRKVNSSGYLNSIFKSRQSKKLSPIAADSTQVNNIPIDLPIDDEETIINSGDSKNRSKPGRTFKSMIGLSNKQQMRNQQQQQQQHNSTNQQGNTHLAQSNYRSYDSSNDSEPSYTNSSDGLDIYDHIGANSRLVGRNQLLNNHHLAPEVHVGEWENMYDR